MRRAAEVARRRAAEVSKKTTAGQPTEESDAHQETGEIQEHPEADLLAGSGLRGRVPGPLKLEDLSREARTHIWNVFYLYLDASERLGGTSGIGAGPSSWMIEGVVGRKFCGQKHLFSRPSPSRRVECTEFGRDSPKAAQ